MIKKSSIFRNIISNWFTLLINIVLVFVTTPVVIKYLGKHEYGLWVILMSIGSYSFILNAGVVMALKRFVPQYIVDKDWEKINKQASTTFFFLVCVAVFILIITVIISWFFPLLFEVENSKIDVLRNTILVVGLDYAVSFVTLTYFGLLFSAQRFDLANYLRILSAILSGVLILCLFQYYRNLFVLALFGLFSNLAMNIGGVILTYIQFPGLSIRYKYFKEATLKSTLTYGVYGLIRDIAQRFIETIGPLMIGVFLTPVHVSYFSIAENLVLRVRILVGGVSGVLMPVVSALEREQKMGSVIQLLTQYSRFLVALTLISFLNFVIIGREFIDLWLSEGFAENAWIPLVIFSLSSVFSYPHYAGFNVLSGLGYPKATTLLVVAEAIGIAICLCIAIPFVGIIGASLAYCITRFIVYGYFVPKKICNIVGINFMKYLKSIYLKVSLSMAPLGMLILILKDKFEIKSWLDLIIVGILINIIFCISCWFVGLEREDRDKCVAKFKNLVPIFS